MPQIVFLTLFLGLASGIHTVDLQVSPGIASVRLFVAGRPAATITKPPWRAPVDFGDSLEPCELAAAGYDADGNEVARVTQPINVPRPVAEVSIMVAKNGDGPASVELHWSHRFHAQPQKVMVTLDDKALPIDKDLRARLPQLDPSVPHVIAAEMRFDHDITGRSEVVLVGKGFSAEARSELTPIAYRETGPPPASLEGCFVAGGEPLHVSAAEKTKALVVLVKDPDAFEAFRALDKENRGLGKWTQSNSTRTRMTFDRDTSERILMAIQNEYTRPGQPTMEVFPRSEDVTSNEGGMLWLITRHFDPGPKRPRFYADAAATAGVMAMSEGRRRAVVLLLGSAPDQSLHSPAVVRRYLASIGVPLYVWSVVKPDAKTLAAWGEVTEVSSNQLLTAATNRVRDDLATQRIAWLATDPLTAIRAKARDGCPIEVLPSVAK